MYRRGAKKGERGFSLFEMMLATAIMAVILGISLIVLKRANEEASVVMLQTFYESRLQTALDDVTMRVVESNPAKISLHAYDMDGRRHTAIVFPTARDRDDHFVLRNVLGMITPTPQWQCLVMYAYSGGFVRRYVDYTPRDYTNIAYLDGITGTQFRVWDGSQFIFFNRDGTPVNANQQVQVILNSARRIFATMSRAAGEPQAPPSAPDVLPGYPDNIYLAVDPPVNLLLEAEVPVAHRPGTTIVVTLDTSVLARNQN